MITTCTSCGKKNRLPASHLADEGKCGACKARLPPSAAPLDVDGAAFEEVRRDAKVPVLVDFWAPWCGPCRMVAPHVAEVAESLAGSALVVKVNTDEHPDIAGRYGVQGIPMFALLKDGELVARRTGAASASDLRRWIEQSARV